MDAKNPEYLEETIKIVIYASTSVIAVLRVWHVAKSKIDKNTMRIDELHKDRDEMKVDIKELDMKLDNKTGQLFKKIDEVKDAVHKGQIENMNANSEILKAINQKPRK